MNVEDMKEPEHPDECTCPDCCEEGGYLWIDGEIVYDDDDDDEENQ